MRHPRLAAPAPRRRAAAWFNKEMGDAKKWSKKDPRDFDEDYLEKMISAHKDAVDLYEKQANKGDDLETKAFARETLPKLQHHLQMALDLKKVVK